MGIGMRSSKEGSNEKIGKWLDYKEVGPIELSGRDRNNRSKKDDLGWVFTDTLPHRQGKPGLSETSIRCSPTLCPSIDQFSSRRGMLNDESECKTLEFDQWIRKYLDLSEELVDVGTAKGLPKLA